MEKIQHKQVEFSDFHKAVLLWPKYKLKTPVLNSDFFP